MKILCAACSMPLEKKEDVAFTDGINSFCKHCVNKDGTVKTAKQVFNGGVSFFMHALPGISLELAERVTRKNMKSLAYWKERNDESLDGPMATEEEYSEAMKSLGE